MRKLTLLLTGVVALSSCSVLSVGEKTKSTERTTVTHFADYRPYTAEGFLISPNAYTGEYESLGEVAITITPSLKEFKREGKEAYLGSYYEYEKISYDELVSIAVKEAKSKGGDALVNFSITSTLIESTGGTFAVGYKYTIEGFCIKRK